MDHNDIYSSLRGNRSDYENYSHNRQAVQTYVRFANRETAKAVEKHNKLLNKEVNKIHTDYVVWKSDIAYNKYTESFIFTSSVLASNKEVPRGYERS